MHPLIDQMKLAVPTLVNYDGLERLLRSAEAGSLQPDGYIVIDNGGSLTLERIRAVVTREVPIQLVSPGENWGVARSWNVALDLTATEPAVVISNDDIVFGDNTFRELVEAVVDHPFVEGEGWALFAESRACVEQVGYYDENFYPAYFEDVDKELRLTRAGIVPFRALSVPVQHAGWATTRALGDPAWLAEGRARNHAYFLRKWGGESRAPRWNGHPGIFQYDEPFNGNPPPGWRLRGVDRTKEPLMVMRWDVLNHIAKRIGARRYLEIGVADGSCMRQVDVAEKWGVDPNPSLGAVSASTFFAPITSDAFFDAIAARVRFDLVFVDGDHIAEQVLREVEGVLPLLTARGVIVFHDCNPHTEAMQEVPFRAGEWTGDVWKAVARLRKYGCELRVVNSDYGIGVLIPTSDITWPFDVGVGELTWSDLVAARESLLGLIEPWEWEAWFDALR